MKSLGGPRLQRCHADKSTGMSLPNLDTSEDEGGVEEEREEIL